MNYHKIHSPFKRDPNNGNKFTKEWSHPVLEWLSDKKDFWTWSQKLDGTNVWVTAGDMGGKTENSTTLTQHPELALCLEDIQARIQREGYTWLRLYGEGIGPKIQGNFEKRPKQVVEIFDAQTTTGRWLDAAEYHEVMTRLGLTGITVPRIPFTASLQDFIKSCALEAPPARVTYEGYVLRPRHELMSSMGRVIVKVKYKDFVDV